jgi:transposase-like protein
MNLIDVTRKFASKETCLEYLAQMRWPDGITCPKCGVIGSDQFRKFTTKETMRKRFSAKKQETVTVRVPSRHLYECKGCGYQFAATTGTVFHDSHLPLEKWFMAIALILEAKKGISALQVGRNLGISEANYRTVWHLCHRIREATKETGLLAGFVEADETFMSPRKPRKGRPRVKNPNRDVVVGMIERGGKLRLVPTESAKMNMLEPIFCEHISPDATLHTDASPAHFIIGKRRFPGRHRNQSSRSICHRRQPYEFNRECFLAFEEGRVRHVSSGIHKTLGALLQRICLQI